MTAPRPKAEDWRHIEALFHEVLELDREARTSYLAAIRADDADIAATIDELLQHHNAASAFLDPGPWRSVVTGIAHATADDEDDPLARPGTQIGRYRLLERIASGGMGTVWLAERVDGEFEQKVAIKLIKRGMDTDDILRRFCNERQLLANFEHPNIARLLDGGATDNGRPYLVMEHVDGVPIDRFCNDHKLSISDRLQLFQTVCNAIHEAHKNLIVHRDLKPSNILITASGEPKLLDFGIAKVVDPAGAVGASMTATALRLLTPQYASPEQIRGDAITTASDVYSLGVILYELLTGCRPYDVATGSRQELERVVLSEEPARPSIMVRRTTSPGNEATGARRTKYGLPDASPRRLRRVLSGDLDTIVLTALRKEPDRRYSSAKELASDIGRHLRDDPITARPDTWLYRSSRFVRRNRGLLLASLTIVVVLLAGAVVSSIGWYRALDNEQQAQKALIDLVRDGLRRSSDDQIAERAAAAGVDLSLKRDGEERLFYIDFSDGGQVPKLAAFAEQIFLWLEEERAQAEAARTMAAARNEVSRSINLFLNEDLLSSVSPARTRNPNLTVREALDRASTRIEGRFDGSPAVEASIRQTIGETYIALGLPKQAIAHLERAVELHRLTLGNFDAATRHTMLQLMEALHWDDQNSASYALGEELLELNRRADGNESASVMATRRIMLMTGDSQPLEQQRAEMHSIVEWNAEHLGPGHPETLAIMHQLANNYIFHREYEQAKPLIDRIWTAAHDIYGPSHPETLWAMLGKAIITDRLGDTEEAVKQLQETVRLYRKATPDNFTDMGITLVHLGNHLDTLERYDEAEAAYLEGYDVLSTSLGPEIGWTKAIIPYLVKLYERTGREDQAAIWRKKQSELERE